MNLSNLVFGIWLASVAVLIGTKPLPEVKEPELVWHVGTMVEQPQIIEKVELKPEPTKTDDITDGVWEWRELVKKYFPQDQWQNALRVMSGENGAGKAELVSRMNRNGTYDYGLFMINTCHKERVGDLNKLLDAETNVKIAYEIWSEQGWKPWVAAQKLGIQ